MVKASGEKNMNQFGENITMVRADQNLYQVGKQCYV